MLMRHRPPVPAHTVWEPFLRRRRAASAHHGRSTVEKDASLHGKPSALDLAGMDATQEAESMEGKMDLQGALNAASLGVASAVETGTALVSAVTVSRQSSGRRSQARESSLGRVARKVAQAPAVAAEAIGDAVRRARAPSQAARFEGFSVPEFDDLLEQLREQLEAASNAGFANGQADQLIEKSRLVAEALAWGEQHELGLFDLFCERRILAYFVTALRAPTVPLAAKVQLLQTLSMLVQNARRETSFYYILSGGHLHKLFEDGIGAEDNEELVAWYVAFLKGVALRLTPQSVRLCLNATKEDFPLFARAAQLATHQDAMVRTSARTALLKLLRLGNRVAQRATLKEARTLVVPSLVRSLSSTWVDVGQAQKRGDSGKLRDALEVEEEILGFISELLKLGIAELTDHLYRELVAGAVLPLLLVLLQPPTEAQPLAAVVRAVASCSRALSDHRCIVEPVVKVLLSPTVPAGLCAEQGGEGCESGTEQGEAVPNPIRAVFLALLGDGSAPCPPEATVTAWAFCELVSLKSALQQTSSDDESLALKILAPLQVQSRLPPLERHAVALAIIRLLVHSQLSCFRIQALQSLGSALQEASCAVLAHKGDKTLMAEAISGFLAEWHRQRSARSVREEDLALAVAEACGGVDTLLRCAKRAACGSSGNSSNTIEPRVTDAGVASGTFVQLLCVHHSVASQTTSLCPASLVNCPLQTANGQGWLCSAYGPGRGADLAAKCEWQPELHDNLTASLDCTLEQSIRGAEKGTALAMLLDTEFLVFMAKPTTPLESETAAAMTVSAVAPLWRLKAVTLHPEDEFILQIFLDPAPGQQEDQIDLQLRFETEEGAAGALRHLEASRDNELSRLWSELEAFLLQESAYAVARTEETTTNTGAHHAQQAVCRMSELTTKEQTDE